MLVPLDILKIIQASAVLLKSEAPQRISRLRLLKFLYVGDRESLAKRGRPITGDRPVAMDNGPVLSTTYSLIKGSDNASSVWERYFSASGRDIMLREDPGVGKLSRWEIEKLQEISQRFVAEDDWAVAEFTHKYEEWEKNRPAKGSMKPIPLDDLLAATQLTAHKQELLEDLRVETKARELFG
jgi:uncharacterized phage-associated protein